jgi:hypothetical protein
LALGRSQVCDHALQFARSPANALAATLRRHRRNAAMRPSSTKRVSAVQLLSAYPMPSAIGDLTDGRASVAMQ